ncbi:hypothetical protein GFS31_01210 [Leptolyngbya sp. BL0902]|uniref:hypothetical protein n=1 Tax=Leptolyngbya sp. BL0902 TaxID=1115757 RepID=UPI0018E751E8|nr:hypothetical protein [Leptolyngbya sp. BL0902]QQE63456.1 hypothetical protein GFS31_01210 [Leptolyngbya sp. BL0902]
MKAAMVTVLLLGATAPAALANGISIQTDRVQVRVNDNGGVQIRTSASPPVIFNADADLPAVRSNLPASQSSGVRCAVRSQSSHSQVQSVTPSGDRIYTENYSTIRVCQ